VYYQSQLSNIYGGKNQLVSLE